MSPEKRDKSSSQRKRRILIVDDEAAFTRIAKINLEDTGKYVVQAENDPRLALPAALDFGPELLLLDVMMPELDGGDIFNRFKEHPALREVPIVFLTATVKKHEVEERCGRIGGVRFLSKPLDLPSLLNCLDEVFAAAAAAEPKSRYNATE
jgi:CheY-like chemotaxis protein